MNNLKLSRVKDFLKSARHNLKPEVLLPLGPGELDKELKNMENQRYAQGGIDAMRGDEHTPAGHS